MTDAIEIAVVELIEDVLALDPGEATPDARFIEDLGGESIELLELSFHCEKRFATRARFQEMMDQKNLSADSDGRLTPAGLAWLREQYPFLDLTEFSKEPRLGRMTELLTVKAIVEFVRRSIEAAHSVPASGTTIATA